jgi:uncharacterized lipoprotein YehR (DUF1307 family)
MKRIMAVIVVVAVCLGALVAAGCGETDKAKSYMEEGDTLSKEMRSLSDQSGFDVVGMLAELGVQVSETGNIDPQTVTDEAERQIDSIVASGEKAKAEYQKILELKDVEDYKSYAEERIKAIDSTIAVLEAVGELLGMIGDPANQKSVSATAAEWAKSNTQTAVDAVKAYSSWRSADNIRKEKNLGPEEVIESAPLQQSTPASKP